MNDIRVYVVKYPDRKNLVMRYRDPLTEKHVQRSARTSKQKEAERKAAKWESELQDGRYHKPSRTTWEEFREKYELEIVTGLADGRYHKPSRTTWEEFREKYELEIVTGLADTTALKISGVLNAVESYVNPQYVRDMTAASIDRLERRRQSGDHHPGPHGSLESRSSCCREVGHDSQCPRRGASCQSEAKQADEGPSHHDRGIRADVG